jgi:hypothetical protein
MKYSDTQTHQGIFGDKTLFEVYYDLPING